jgi:hypothetical protein
MDKKWTNCLVAYVDAKNFDAIKSAEENHY